MLTRKFQLKISTPFNFSERAPKKVNAFGIVLGMWSNETRLLLTLWRSHTMDFLLNATQWEPAWLPAPVEEITETWSSTVFPFPDTGLTIHVYMCPEEYHKVEISLRAARGCAPALEKLQIFQRAVPRRGTFKHHSGAGPAIVRWDTTDAEAVTEQWYCWRGQFLDNMEEWDVERTRQDEPIL